MQIPPDNARYNHTPSVICSFLPKKKGTLGEHYGTFGTLPSRKKEHCSTAMF